MVIKSTSSELSISSSISNRTKGASTSIKTLPDEILVMEIIVRVASTSFADLFNLKLASKSFSKASEDHYIFKHVSIKEFPVIPWWKNRKASEFLKKCRRSGNAEALYRKGMVNYFSSRCKQESGIECLREAAEKGHREATYVHGILSICFGNQSKQKGFDILSSFKKQSFPRTMRDIEECRERIRGCIWRMWTNRSVAKQLERLYRPERCKCDGETLKALAPSNGWTQTYRELETGPCESCLWHHEVSVFLDYILGKSCFR